MTDTAARPVATACRRFKKAKMRRLLASSEAKKEGRLPDPGSIFTADSKFERAIWQAILDVLGAYHRPSNWPGLQPIETIPADVTFHVAEALGELVSFGKIPAQWKVLISRDGKPAWSASDPRCDAVRYIRAARAGEIDDPAALKTVAGHFGVSMRSVQKWWADEALASAEDAEREASTQSDNGPATAFGVAVRLEMDSAAPRGTAARELVRQSDAYKQVLNDAAEAEAARQKASLAEKATLIALSMQKSGERYQATSPKSRERNDRGEAN